MNNHDAGAVQHEKNQHVQTNGSEHTDVQVCVGRPILNDIALIPAQASQTSLDPPAGPSVRIPYLCGYLD